MTARRLVRIEGALNGSLVGMASGGLYMYAHAVVVVAYGQAREQEAERLCD